MNKPIQPIAPRVSQYGVDPKFVTKRMSEYPEMVSVMLRDLFDDTRFCCSCFTWVPLEYQ